MKENIRNHKTNQNILFFVLILIIITFIIIGFIDDGILKALNGFLKLQISPTRLVSDFIEMEGIGPAFFNSAVTALVALLCVRMAGVSLSGAIFAAILTILGFGLFGKTPANIIPIILGVFLSTRFAKKTFKEYIIIALFGTALGPLVNFVAFELTINVVYAIPIAIGAGIATGFMLPSIAVAMLHLHQGYNLYNMGLSCGFFALFAASFFKISDKPFTPLLFWYNESKGVLLFLIPVISVFFLLLSLILGKTKALKDFLTLQKQSGRLPSDFIDIVSLEGTLFNVGIIGLLGSGLVYFTGSSFNGPVLGALFTIMGFGAFGTHLKNSLPVICGIILSALLFGLPLDTPSVILAILFGTTLAPLAGQFGIFIGLIAGFLHMILVSQKGAWHGALNLYNNGFAGGLTATLVVAVIQWMKTNRPDLFDK